MRSQRSSLDWPVIDAVLLDAAEEERFTRDVAQRSRLVVVVPGGPPPAAAAHSSNTTMTMPVSLVPPQQPSSAVIADPPADGFALPPPVTRQDSQTTLVSDPTIQDVTPPPPPPPPAYSAMSNFTLWGGQEAQERELERARRRMMRRHRRRVTREAVTPMGQQQPSPKTGFRGFWARRTRKGKVVCVGFCVMIFVFISAWVTLDIPRL